MCLGCFSLNNLRLKVPEIIQKCIKSITALPARTWNCRYNYNVKWEQSDTRRIFGGKWNDLAWEDRQGSKEMD